MRASVLIILGFLIGLARSRFKNVKLEGAILDGVEVKVSACNATMSGRLRCQGLKRLLYRDKKGALVL